MTTIIMLPAPPPAGPIGTDSQSRPGSPTTDFARVLDEARAPSATVLPFTRGGAGSAATGSVDANAAEVDGAVAPGAQLTQVTPPVIGAAAVAATGTAMPPTALPTEETGLTEAAEPTELTEVAEATEPTLAAATAATVTAPVTSLPGVATTPTVAGTESTLADVAELVAAGVAHAAPSGAATSSPLPAAEAITGAATPPAPAENGVGQVGAVHRTAPSTTARAADAPMGTTAATAATAGDLPAPGTPVADAQSGAPSPATVPQADASTPGVVGIRVPTQHSAPVALPEAPLPAAPALGPQVAEQLRAKLPGLRAAGLGQHVLTLRVEPESIGPVRVVAHIGAEGVRVELLGGTEAARDALRAALPDLRRDLAGSGLSDLGLGREGDRGGHDDAPTRQSRPEQQVPDAPEATVPQPDTGSARSRSRLDLLV